MTQDTSPERIPVSSAWSKRARIDAQTYDRKYRQSVDDPEAFWNEELDRIDWIKRPTEISDVSWSRDDLHIR
ncbi:MAG TPA: acetyl-coenzyme A synthetase, partial [Alphaproteobacteria bacterium]|nr:acetyl-coenzyme A synthetase [Alphaproteobacteria bacterium]